MTNRRKQEARFDEGSAFNLFTIPRGLDGGALLGDATDVTNFDVVVYDRDATKPNRPSEPVFEALGLDPLDSNGGVGLAYFLLAAGVNPSKPTFRTGDGWTADDNGYVFVYRVDSTLWDRVEGGHTYLVEISFHTVNNGIVFFRTLMLADETANAKVAQP